MKLFHLFILLLVLLTSCQTIPTQEETALPQDFLSVLSHPDDKNTQRHFPWIEEKTINFMATQEGNAPAPRIKLSYQSQSIPMVRFRDSNRYFLSLPFTKDLIGTTYLIEKFQGTKSLAGPDPLNPYVQYQKPLSSLIIDQNWPGEAFYRVPKWRTTKLGSGLLARDVYVWLPSGYFTHREWKLPVLYMHDGQQVWDSDLSAWGGWKTETAARDLISQGKIPPVIIVGILNSSMRGEEYLGWQNSPGSKKHLIAQDYGEFLVNEVKPWVDSTFRTRPDRGATAIAGSSNGSAVALYLGGKYPQVFSKVAGLSNAGTSVNQIMNLDFNPGEVQVYLDCGGRDLDAKLASGVDKLYWAYKEKGFTDEENLLYQSFPEEPHNEASWAKRMPRILEWFFGKAHFQ